MKENNKITDETFYRLSKEAYRNDKDLEDSINIKNAEEDTVQTWKVGETFHDKQTGMDAVAFERVVDGKKQVMVAFRGTEGDKIFEKDSLKPGEGMKDALTDGRFFIKRDGVHDPAPAPRQEKGEKIKEDIGTKRMGSGNLIINSNKLTES